jgi:hypothetical protein
MSISKARQNDLLDAMIVRLLSSSRSGAVEVATTASPKLTTMTVGGTWEAMAAPF